MVAAQDSVARHDNIRTPHLGEFNAGDTRNRSDAQHKGHSTYDVRLGSLHGHFTWRIRKTSGISTSASVTCVRQSLWAKSS